MPADKVDLSRYKGKKVAVAMSGGVDSSVAAFLLKNAGADIFGITMKTIPGSKCCSIKDINDAKAVAKSLKIPHYIVELGELFKKTAIDYFVNESLGGKNPNPCVPCNQKIKFGALIEEAEKLGAEYFATGHYARIENGKLKRPVDVKKDQSYVLSMLPRKVFAKLIFPIGDYTKDEVRKIAELNKIKVFAKQENQDLCFLYKEKGEFIEEWTGNKCKPGNIVDAKGNVLGKHDGIVHYTIGQRRGLGLKNQEKLYVKDIDAKKNEIIVGTKEELFRKHFYVNGLNWVAFDKLKKEMDVEVLIRNKTAPEKVKIVPEGEKVKVVPKKPVWAVSPGQIAVFIKKDLVLGGGWIE